MKLRGRAKRHDLGCKTAWRTWKDGGLFFAAEELPTGMVIVHVEPERSHGVALYEGCPAPMKKAD
ncbi:hypothetical protein MPNT_190020 [Candidatus Methylacidithermus pantelleriae]|uniref:Uncharacterized protein n=1 Tax=Candidatus Methylacidithermus pantelleriae TaxID=2744239 RepID=A0A8J2BL37_9BACT|nr:hypothetical protein MPNT_190020 [Candidatus Methylacidithermus pantelleriae]